MSSKSVGKPKQQQEKTSATTFLVALAIGVVIRLALVHFGFFTTFADRVEITTPINSFKRGHPCSIIPPFFCVVLVFVLLKINSFVVKEGVYLASIGLSPYDGSIFHESPLTLILFYPLLQMVGLFGLFVEIYFC
jgi:phosphatidylinositol glycan class U